MLVRVSLEAVLVIKVEEVRREVEVVIGICNSHQLHQVVVDYLELVCSSINNKMGYMLVWLLLSLLPLTPY